jgi:hypothetical protein
MPRYFLDTDDGLLLVQDEHGYEFKDVEAAEREALIAAASIARDIFVGGTASRVLVRVRDEARVVFEAQVLLRKSRFN